LATGFIYNAFGKYEDREGEKGITLNYAGVGFWLPYQRVTAIPNWNFREVDHDRSTPQGDSVGELVYMNVIINGQRVVEELCMKQVPVPNHDMGIIPIEGKTTGKMVMVPAGVTAEGVALTVEVAEREPTRPEKEKAENLCRAYKEKVVADYLQSKRERMSGGQGRVYPDARTRMYMEEMGIEDLDDVTAHAKNSGLNPDLLALILKEVGKANSEAIAENIVTAVETIRKAQKAQLSPNAKHGKRSLGLAEEKARREAELAAKES